MTRLVNEKHYPFFELKSLPRLPIPKLEDTLSKFLKTVSPLLTPEEFRQTSALVDEFAREAGPDLHRRLQTLESESPTSYLEGFWDSMYLEIREPIPVHVNPFFAFEDDPENFSQTGRAASLVYSSLNFFQRLKANKLSPDKERNVPLDMCQYGRIIGSTRIPQAKRDVLLTYPDSKHIVVMARGQFYWFDVFLPSGEIMSEYDIRVNLKKISSQSRATNKKYLHAPLGVLTTDDRPVWAEVRARLIADGNAEPLEIVQRALFILCLDDAAPPNLSEFSKLLLHSNGKNRWFDKSIQLIVCANGKSGINMEHSGIDGHTVLRYAFEIDSDSIRRGRVTSRTQDPPTRDAPPATRVTKLEWNLTPPLLESIREAEAKFHRLTASVDSAVCAYTGYGKNFMTKHNLSPDGVVQMCFQLAYYRIFGRPGATYESSLTKQFYHGRTECVRSVSADSVEFCKTFVNAKSDVGAKAASLRKAVATHVKIMNECKNGHGVNRHLYAMLWLARHQQQRISGYEIPALYRDKGWEMLTTDYMSTSNCGNQTLCLFGFGPVIPDGFGLGYIIRDNGVNVNVTSFMGKSNQFAHELEQAFADVRAVLEQTSLPTSKL